MKQRIQVGTYQKVLRLFFSINPNLQLGNGQPWPNIFYFQLSFQCHNQINQEENIDSLLEI